MDLRLACSGPSGTGKTTLSEYISEQYGIPFITTSTKPLWAKYDIKSHAELIGKTTTKPQWGLEFQNEVLDYRINLLSKHREFVTDRSPVDNMAYFLIQNSHLLTEQETFDYAKKCSDAISMFTGLIIMPYTSDIVLEDDGMRVGNKYYQLMMNHVFNAAKTVMQETLLPGTNFTINNLTITQWDMEKRKKQIAEAIVELKLR